MKFKRLLPLWLTLSIIISALTGCLSLPAATQPASKADDEKVLNVFNWSEYLPESVIKDFEAKYGIKVNYLTYESNEEMLAKIMAGDDIFDLSVASGYLVDVMRKQKLMEEIDMKNIPNFKNIGDEFKKLPFDPENRFSVPYMWGSGVIAVNTARVPIDATSYGDLWDSRFRNSLVVLDDQRELMAVAHKKLGYSANERDPAKLEQARQELLKLKPNIKSFNSESPKDELIKGNAVAGYMWGAEAVKAARENKDIKIFFPKEGMTIWQDNFVIPKGAVHKKNAELFINFVLEPMVSAEISRSYPYANPNLEAHRYIDASDLSNPAIYLSEENLKNVERFNDVEDATKLYDKIWAEFRGQ